MVLLYRLLIRFALFSAHFLGFFSLKVANWISVRKNQNLPNLKGKKVIWMHSSSLGEYEQGKPVFDSLKEKLEGYVFVLSFFSSSGYEIVQKRGKAHYDYIVYLPADTYNNVSKFLDYINPEIVIFVKYDFWLNLLKELNCRKITTIYISVLLKKNSLFFSIIYKPIREELRKISRFFVQNDETLKCLKDFNFKNVEIAGDTRIDRVIQIANSDFKDSIIEEFIETNKKTLICGSTWEEDINVLSKIESYLLNNFKIIIAPHVINSSKIENIRISFKNSQIAQYTDKKPTIENDILIIDKIGILSQIYRYADVAYVGGGFGTGIHNTLEPGAYKIPVIFGPKFRKFAEAVELVDERAFFAINSSNELEKVLFKLQNDNFYNQAKNVLIEYFKKNKNNSIRIVDYLQKIIYDTNI